MTSAFIIEVDSQLKSDPGDETAALLRVLIYKIDNTTFGGDTPTLPQWDGPPHAIVQVQAILFASLAASLFSAFLAMLGKQWLNRYDSADMRGSAIERSQNRQRKLNGIVAWYFDYVMGSLPLMLQAALLLLGCALSLYLWGVNTTVASVILGVTSFGALSYLSIVVAAAASESCPYQTPGSNILRYLGQKIPRKPYPSATAIGDTLRKCEVIDTIVNYARYYRPWRHGSKIIPFLRDLASHIPPAFVADVHHLARVAIRTLRTLTAGAYHLVRGVYHRLRGMHSLERGLDRQTAALNVRCISWTLQTSLDKSTHFSTLKYLATIAELTDFESTLVVHCFNVFVGCISLNNRKIVIIQGLEQLATVSVECFYRTFHLLLDADPTSSVVADVRRRYRRVFPLEADFRGLSFFHTTTKIHGLAYQRWNPRDIRWADYTPSHQEYIPFSGHMVQVAQAEYLQMEKRKVPRWILRFALHSLSLDPLPPASVVANSLMIIAIDLGLYVLNVLTLDERYAKI